MNRVVQCGVVLAAMLLLAVATGCGEPKTHEPKEQPRWGVSFRNYHGVFKFIAENNDLPTDADTLLNLASESRIEMSSVDRYHGKGLLYVIEARYRDQYYGDQLRGAHGCGPFYVLKSKANDPKKENLHNAGFELVGVLEGDRWNWGSDMKDAFTERYKKLERGPWKWSNINTIITSSHESAAETYIQIYEWKGNHFELVKSYMDGEAANFPDNLLHIPHTQVQITDKQIEELNQLQKQSRAKSKCGVTKEVVYKVLGKPRWVLIGMYDDECSETWFYDINKETKVRDADTPYTELRIGFEDDITAYTEQGHGPTDPADIKFRVPTNSVVLLEPVLNPEQKR